MFVITSLFLVLLTKQYHYALTLFGSMGKQDFTTPFCPPHILQGRITKKVRKVRKLYQIYSDVATETASSV